MGDRMFFSLTSLVRHLNSSFGKKKNGTSFTVSDVKGYARRGRLPKFLGNQRLERLSNEELRNVNSTVPLYRIR